MIIVCCGLDQRFVKFGGAFSQEQLQWLDEVLSLADQKHERVTIVSKYNPQVICNIIFR